MKVSRLVLEPKNVVDIPAVVVEKEDQIVGHLNRRNSGRFAKIVFYFLRANNKNICQVQVRGKKVNLGESTMNSSVLRRRKAYKNIEKQFTVLASICLFVYC